MKRLEAAKVKAYANIIDGFLELIGLAALVLLLLAISGHALEFQRPKNAATLIPFPMVSSTTAMNVTGESGNFAILYSTWNTADNVPSAFMSYTANAAAEFGTTGVYYLPLTQSVMNSDYIQLLISDAKCLQQNLSINTAFANGIAGNVWANSSRSLTDKDGFGCTSATVTAITATLGAVTSVTNPVTLAANQDVRVSSFTPGAEGALSRAVLGSLPTNFSALTITTGTTVSSDLTTIVFSDPGTVEWTCLSYITNIQIETYGSGAGGQEGPGGGGGAYSRVNSFNVTPGNVYTLRIGLHGTGSNNNGESSAFIASGSTICLAAGGTVPTGGQASDSIGDVKHSGGNGGARYNNGQGTYVSGGGGSSAGTLASGNNGTDGTFIGYPDFRSILGVGGAAPVGGVKGGNAGNNGQNGENGADGGGGAGGIGYITWPHNSTGGNGLIRISYHASVTVGSVNATVPTTDPYLNVLSTTTYGPGTAGRDALDVWKATNGVKDDGVYNGIEPMIRQGVR